MVNGNPFNKVRFEANGFDWVREIDRLKMRQRAQAAAEAAQAPPPPPERNPMEDFVFDLNEEIAQQAAPVRAEPWGDPPQAPPGWDIGRGDPRRKDKPMMNIKDGPSEFRSITERSTRLPRFKLQYASADECRMRLEGTLVTVQDRMVKIMKIQMVRQGMEAGLGCVAKEESGDLVNLLFSDEGLNLRSPDPGYIQVTSEAYMFRRRPARVYKQGISGENTLFIRAGRPADGPIPLIGGIPDHTMLKAFNERPILQYDPGALEKLNSMRLSDRIAVFKKNGGKIHVEHRGYSLGPVIRGNKVKVEAQCLWTQNALNAVGLEAVE